jgi:hypothetical protein
VSEETAEAMGLLGAALVKLGRHDQLAAFKRLEGASRILNEEYLRSIVDYGIDGPLLVPLLVLPDSPTISLVSSVIVKAISARKMRDSCLYTLEAIALVRQMLIKRGKMNPTAEDSSVTPEREQEIAETFRPR